MKTRDEALQALCKIYGVEMHKDLTFEKKEVNVDLREVHRKRVYAAAVSLAKTPDDYVELDYIMSKVPYDVTELEVFCSTRGFRIKEVIE